MCEKVENSLEKQALYSPVTSAVHVKESYCFLTYIKKIKNQSHHLSRQGVTNPSLGNYQINYLFVQLRLLSPVFLWTFNNNINIILTASNNLRKEDLICNKMLFKMKRIMQNGSSFILLKASDKPETLQLMFSPHQWLRKNILWHYQAIQMLIQLH